MLVLCMNKKLVLGVDIGNVVINHRLVSQENKDNKSFYETQYSSVPATDGVFDALKTLNSYLDGEIYLISKCTPWAEEKILNWLQDNDFYAKTGMYENHIYFVRERHEKDGICQKLGITSFVDDRLEVLSHMVETVPYLFLYQSSEDEVNQFIEFLSKVTTVTSWDEIVEEIKKL